MSQNPSQLDYLDALDASSSPLLDFFIRYKRVILYSLLGLAVVLAGVFRFVSARSSNAEQDYLNAEIDVYHLQSGGEKAEKSLLKLQQLLDQHGELHAKYDGLIAQNLLKLKNVPMAKEYASDALRRTSNEGGLFYTQFSETSLLIAEGKYEEALQQAEQLNQKLSTAIQQGESTLLYAYNLLRLGMLHQQLAHVKEEALCWNEMLRCLSPAETPVSPALIQSFQLLSSHFQEGNVSLKDYIHERLGNLK